VLPDRIRRAIHDGLLANDLVGFHTRRWRPELHARRDDVAEPRPTSRGPRHLDERRTLVTVHPISVDSGEFDELASSEPVLEAERELVARRPEKLVLRVDRTDPSKNIVRGFRAFELYLEAHPRCTAASACLLYSTLRARRSPSTPSTSARSARGPAGQRPLPAGRLVAHRPHDPGQLHRLCSGVQAFDALFVNAIFDGMNLVAKEAPLVNERDGVLILSENAGAHAELGEWALTVNPFDVAGQAEAIDTALTMGESERSARLEAIRGHVRDHDVAEWIEAPAGRPRPLPRERFLELELLDDDELAVLAHDALDVRLLVARRDHEPVAVSADLLVVLRRDVHLLEAGLVAALTDPLGIRVGEVALQVRDALVHLSEQLLVLDDPLLPVHAPSTMLSR
jgi:trehalose 6-phosphate synthase